MNAPIEILCWFVPLFLTMWLGVSAALSLLGGWHVLSKSFCATERAEGETFRMASAAIGSGFIPTNYNHCLTITMNDAGFSLRIWPMFRFLHPPLFIPWSAVEDFKVGRYWFSKSIKLSVQNGDVAIRLIGQAAEHAAEILSATPAIQ